MSSPEVITTRLLSSDINLRINALEQIGAPQALRHPPLKPDYGDLTVLTGLVTIRDNLDDDPEQEMLIVVDQTSYFTAALLDQQGGRWYRLAVFGCWCRYERRPLQEFVELRRVVSLSHKDMIVRDSGGGSGLYVREIAVFHIERGAVHEVFQVEEERENCHPTEGDTWRSCTNTQAQVDLLGTTSPEMPARLAVTAREGYVPFVRKHIEIGKPPVYYPPSNIPWHSRIRSCQGYIWSPRRSRFVADRETTSLYCEAVNPRWTPRLPDAPQR